MKKDKNSNFSICVWLGIISFILFCGVIIFAAYLYKFNPLSMFSDIFHLDKSIGWNALEALGTICIGVVTIWLSSKVSKFQENQANIQNMQNMLYIEPHILVDSFVLLSAECELNNEKTEIKSLKGIDYPFFTNCKENLELNDMYVLSIAFVNTSEAFARLRFNEATITNGNETIGSFNISTFGTHKNHIMLKKEECKTIGLVINSETKKKLRGSKITISCFLDNNYNSTFKDVQSYIITSESDGMISFMPTKLCDNTYEKV
jgi:hypothetical protein